MPEGKRWFLFFNYDIQNAFYRLKVKKIKFFKIGRTSLSKNILCAHIGNYSKKQILIVGATHAREYITTLLICKMIEFYAHAKFDGGIYFVPMLNPDGVDVCINGVKNISDVAIKNYIIENAKSYRNFKSNAMLVDLNVNFPAKWGKGNQNVFEPKSENFVGFKSASENEVKAIMNFCQRIKPDMVISYHSKGEEIYYNFNQNKFNLKRDLSFAKAASQLTGYKVKKLKGSVGGFKDWCIQNFKIPALTVEVGSKHLNHPIGKKSLSKIFQQNLKLPLVMFEKLEEYDKVKCV